jgi:acyl-CoA reductase-like NAD-dependent aldehyde dehydrogenase
MSALIGVRDGVGVGNIAIPERAGFAATSHPEIDAAVAAVSSRRAEWPRVSVARRIELLDRMIADTYAVARRWVEAECERKGIAFDSPASGEEWGTGPWCVLSNMRQLRGTLRDIERAGRPRLPGAVRTTGGGRVRVRIFPREAYDRAIYTGLTGEVWMPPGVSAEEVQATVGGIYRARSRRESRVGAILGAGNLSAIPLMDVIYKVFAGDEVVVLKLNPITNHLRGVFSEALRALIDGGYLRIVQGGADEARHLVHHTAIDTVHLTGSDKTHDAIVFGTGKDAAARKAENRPLLNKPISSELGNVTPVIIVPGKWSRSAFDFHAQMLASTLAQAGSYECITPRVLVTPAGWSGREKLLAALRRILRQTPHRFAYYPGAQERFSLFTGRHPEAELLGAGAPGSLAWALIPGVDPGSDDLVFSTDPFAPVLAETPIGASSVADFIDRAVSFCNDRVWGTLAAAVIAQPRSLRSPDTKAAFERGIATLRYGTIVVNGPTFYGFSLVSPPWGAFPGHKLTDIQSGRGVVHNTYLLTHTEKTVFRAPFRTMPKPPWYVTHRRCHGVFSQMTSFEAAASPAKLPGIFWAVIRG